MKEEKRKIKMLPWLFLGIALIIIYKMLDKFPEIMIWIKGFLSVVMPFIMGVILAYLLYIPCKQVEKCLKKIKTPNKIARPLSIFLVYVLFILLIILVVNIIIPVITESFADLTQNLPGYYKMAKEYINNMPENTVIKKESIQETINNLEKIDIAKMISAEKIADYIKGVMGVASWIFSAFVTFIMSIYVLLERTQIVEFVKKINQAMFKEKTCKKANKYFFAANNILFKFISTQVLDGIIIGIISAIFLSILKVKYAVLLGIMIGLLNIIPYFGAIVGVAIAAIITVFTGGFGKAIWMLVVIIITQQIDANIINPKLLGNSLKLSPILIIFSVTLLGAYWGVLGMFLAVPMVAVIKMLLIDYLDNKIEKGKKKEE